MKTKHTKQLPFRNLRILTGLLSVAALAVVAVFAVANPSMITASGHETTDTVDQIDPKEMILPLVVIDVHEEAAENPIPFPHFDPRRSVPPSSSRATMISPAISNRSSSSANAAIFRHSNTRS